MGSTTYEWLLDQEDVLGHPEKWQAFFGAMRTVVFSSRTLPVPRGADVLIVDGPVASHISAIRERAAQGVVWVVGGGVLASQFLAAGLLDRVEVTVAPVILGSGAAMFASPIAFPTLRLREAQVGGPFVHAIYDVEGEPRVVAPHLDV